MIIDSNRLVISKTVSISINVCLITKTLGLRAVLEIIQQIYARRKDYVLVIVSSIVIYQTLISRKLSNSTPFRGRDKWTGRHQMPGQNNFRVSNYKNLP